MNHDTETTPSYRNLITAWFLHLLNRKAKYNWLERANIYFGIVLVLSFAYYLLAPQESCLDSATLFQCIFYFYLVVVFLNVVNLLFNVIKHTQSLLILNEFDFLAISYLILFFVTILLNYHLTGRAVSIIEEKHLIHWMAYMGISYWTIYLLIWIFRPVLRDWILVKGNIIRRITLCVLFSPFVIAVLCGYLNPDFQSSELLTSAEDEEITTTPPMNDETNTLLNVYYHFIDPGNQPSAHGERGKFWAGLISFMGIILLNGLLVTTLINWFDRRREGSQNGENYYKHPFPFSRKRKYVIIGGNEMSFGIVANIFQKDPNAYIIIQTSCDIDDFRRRLFSTLTISQCLNVLIYYGNRSSEEDIKKLKLIYAQELYILGEEIEEDNKGSYHDTLNMKCLELIAKTLPDVVRKSDEKKNLASYILRRLDTFGKYERLTCYVMFEFQSTFSIFQFSEVSKKINHKINFVPFNGYEMWAQRVLINQSIVHPLSHYYLPLEGTGIAADSDDFVHLVIVGMSRMGVALALEAAHIAHYPNYPTRQKRTRITFIDHQMDQEIDYFRGRFDALLSVSRTRYVEVDPTTEAGKGSSLYSTQESDWSIIPSNLRTESYAKQDNSHLGGDFLDVEWEFIKGSIADPTIQLYLKDAAENPHAKLTIAICIPESNQAMAAAIYLPSTVFEKTNVQQILVFQRTNNSLLKNMKLDPSYPPYYGKLKGFGMLSETFDNSLNDQSKSIAINIQDVYDAIYKDEGLTYSTHSWSIVRMMTQDQHLKKVVSPTVTSFEEQLHYLQNWLHQRSTDEAFMKDVKRCEKEKQVDSHVAMEKTPVSKWWSNIYNGNMLWTKLRCLLTPEQKDMLTHLVATCVSGSQQHVEGKELHAFLQKACESLHFTEIQEALLAEVEHNRWNLEQLLMLYRPLTPAEQYLVVKELPADLIQLIEHPEEGLKNSSFEKVKSYYKGRMAHLNLCSSDILRKTDFSYKYDVGIGQNLFQKFIDTYAIDSLTRDILALRKQRESAAPNKS